MILFNVFLVAESLPFTKSVGPGTMTIGVLMVDLLRFKEKGGMGAAAPLVEQKFVTFRKFF